MSVLLTVAGAGLVLLVREVFHSIFRPSGQGRVTMTVFRLMWPATGRLGGRARSLSGPLSVYPALRRQRAAAGVAHALRRSHERTSTIAIHPATAARQLERLSAGLNAVRADFPQYPTTFYFAAPERTLSLAAARAYQRHQGVPSPQAAGG